MPTASTSQILGNNECFEPYTSNMYTRRTIAGDFIIVNKYLIEECCKRGIWNKELKDKIMVYNGSIQHIDEIPDDIKSIYKTVWEIKQKHIIQLAADRGPYICQTQSMNLFFEEPTNKTLSSALFYGWKAGLKTGSYYIRSQPRVQAQQFTVDPRVKKKSTTSINTEFKMNINPNMSNISHVKGEVSKREQCARDNQEACDYCSG
jgi:ribonucleoside-diphosphate reductase alpha chain